MKFEKIVKKILGEQAHFNWQNLNDTPYGAKGSGIVHGRAWLYLNDTWAVNTSWKFGGWNLLLQVDAAVDEPHVGVGAGIGPVFLHLRIDVPYKLMRKLPGDRHVRIDISNNTLYADLWTSPWKWGNAIPWWKQRQFSVDFANLVLGKKEYTEIPIKTEAAVIPMPEGEYPCMIKLVSARWNRPRSLIKTEIKRAHIEFPKGVGIPFPGKGSMSYNCGMDGLYGMTTGPVGSVRNAIKQVVDSVTASRTRYGRLGWLPEEKDIPKECIRRGA